ncbi:MAG: bifunctional hydroxymethylpyrimidine kinase/phosphomethylpyrimidine kinase [Desulfovibrionaceae bacterium]
MDKEICTLTIAGSDSGGGAGIQADIKTMTILNTFATCVLTAITAQTGKGVYGIVGVEPRFVAEQLSVVLEDFPIKAIKIGMLFSEEIITSIAAVLKNYPHIPLIVDPVCASQSGHTLLDKGALGALQHLIIKDAFLITPNIPEAEMLTGLTVQKKEDILPAIKALYTFGAKAVLLKGGHFTDSSLMMSDWLYMPELHEELIVLSHKKVKTEHNHGTGCTLSAAITSFVAKGLPLQEAIVLAKKYLVECLLHSSAPGEGIGCPKHNAVTAFLMEK